MPDLNQKFIWFSRGAVYVRLEKNQEPIKITCNADIEKLLEKNEICATVKRVFN